MKALLVGCLLSVSVIPSFAQTAADTWSVKFSDAIIARYQPTLDDFTGKGWEYTNSSVLFGMEKVYEQTSDANYLNYIKDYIDLYVNSSGQISDASRGVTSTSFSSLDVMNPAILCVFLYHQTGQSKYQIAAKAVRDYLVNDADNHYPKTPDGGYWHKNSSGYSNVMMLDEIFMGDAFLADYGGEFGDLVALDTAASQALLLASHVYDGTKHLVKHAWTSDPSSHSWANSGTGISPSVWSRGMGWFVVSLVEILRYLPNTDSHYTAIQDLLTNLVTGMQTYQDPSTGLWWQVVDKGSALSGNYIETSGSAMFVYAIKTAVDSGWIANSYLSVAQAAWTGLQSSTYITPNYDSYGPSINSFAPAMSVQSSDANYVQSSYQPVSIPGSSSPHGYAGILLAASAMEFPITPLPIKFTAFKAFASGHAAALTWQNPATVNDVEYYIVQRSADGLHFDDIGQVSPNASGSYEWTDNNPASSVAYYRIEAVKTGGSNGYSNILSVKLETLLPGLFISPNPVRNGQVHLRFANMEAGVYTLRIISSTGKAILVKTVAVADGESMHTVSLPPLAHKGLYYIKMEGGAAAIQRPLLIE